MDTVPMIIQVKWIDAVADSGWEEKTKAEIHHCITVGYLVDESDEALCLASTWSHNQTNARMHIPKAWISERKVLQHETLVSKAKRKAAPAKGKRRSACKVPLIRAR